MLRVIMPICATAMCLSLAMKPRRTDAAYVTVLRAQYLLLSVGSNILNVAGTVSTVGPKEGQSIIILSLVRSVAFVLILPVMLAFRSRIACLSDADLSGYISMSVIKGGIVIGLAQLAFLALSSIQCNSEATLMGNSWKECTRSLYAQTGEAPRSRVFFACHSS